MLKMENLFIELKIIKDVLKIILKYLTKSHNNLINNQLKCIDTREIIIYDSRRQAALASRGIASNAIFDLFIHFTK
jgi:hypothetical protein